MGVAGVQLESVAGIVVVAAAAVKVVGCGQDWEACQSGVPL